MASEGNADVDRPAIPKPDSWLSKNIASTISVFTLVFSFLLFFYFVYLASMPNPVSPEVTASTAMVNDLTAQYAKATDPKERTQLLESLNMAQRALDNNLRIALDQKDQKGMMKDFVLYILGVLSSLITTVFGYYFGSSRSSAKKDDAFAKMVSDATSRPAEPPVQ